MTAATGTVDARLRSLGSSTAWLQRNMWTLGLLGLLALLLALTKFIQPNYAETGIGSLAVSVLPLALAAAAPAIIVISGGIDLPIGSTMAPCSGCCPRMLGGQRNGFGIAV